jgi:hypothetical protein
MVPHSSNHPSDSNPDCPRCHGMLVPTLLQVGPFDSTGPSFPSAWRCVNCGALLDLQIVMNQSAISDNSESHRESPDRLKPRRLRGGPRLRIPLVSRE